MEIPAQQQVNTQPMPMADTPPIITAPETEVKKAGRRARFWGLVKWTSIPIIILTAVYLLLVFVVPFIEPNSTPQNVKTSNITDRQATVSWATAKATRDLVVLTEDNSFPVFPMFAKKKYVDDGDKGLANPKFYTTHHVTIGDLKPNAKYYFKIYQGVQEVHSGEFTAGPTFASSATPNPVYGRIIKADKTPVAGAIVYLQEGQGETLSSLLSTLTNAQGGWSIDLANLRTQDLQKNYEAAQSEAMEIAVEGGARGRGGVKVSAESKAPLPDIVIK